MESESITTTHIAKSDLSDNRNMIDGKTKTEERIREYIQRHNGKVEGIDLSLKPHRFPSLR